MKLLEVRDLKFAVDGREILHGVDLMIGTGETVVFLGQNGAGKSSIASAIMGIFNEDDESHENGKSLMGQVIFNGKDISSLKTDERAREGIFMSFQAPVEIPGVNMMEMLWTALEERGSKIKRREIEEKIATAVDKLGLDSFVAGREVNVGASGGERKKNELLQMMVLEPKLAILDEIDSGLDIDAAKRMSKVLAEYQKDSGVSYAIITHNMRILKDLNVDRVYLIEDGRIVQTGGIEMVEKIAKEGFSK